jgi:hypothetical protein
MTRLNWNSVGDRRYETGVDRGVLYPLNAGGVPWNGLISVSESPDGGNASAYYIDGFKYYNESTPEEFEATIEAFTYPDEFALCDGTAEIYEGLSITQQPRVAFDMSYRTKVGNDFVGQNFGYKIHLIYNALASPSNRDNETIDNSPDAMTFTWDITTSPILVPNLKPSAHFVVDSTKTKAATLADLEDILYGTDVLVPRMPRPDELITMFNSTPPNVFTSTFGEYF